MKAIELKLKQASAVLGVSPKDLQNLVQFKVLRPTRRDSFYWFDKRLLLEAKVALYLKESLGTSTEVLALFTRALTTSQMGGRSLFPADFCAETTTTQRNSSHPVAAMHRRCNKEQ